MKYIIEDKRQDGCVFCEALDLTDGPENLIVFRGKHAFRHKPVNSLQQAGKRFSFHAHGHERFHNTFPPNSAFLYFCANSGHWTRKRVANG